MQPWLQLLSLLRHQCQHLGHTQRWRTSGLRSLTRAMASSTLPLCTALRISMRSVMAARSTPGDVPDSFSNVWAAST